MKTVILLLSAISCFQILATDRAKVADMSASLLLPDGSYLQVDVFTECTDGGSNVGSLLFDDQHVELFAKGLDAEYGERYGNMLRSAWANKKNPDDPRLPTYIVVFKSGTDTNEKMVSKSLHSIEEAETQSSAPSFIGNCGGYVHKPVGGD
ncbi:hypothetical protein [Pleionea sediminis]|uniref:hypothetical protein n=1 Tax=Pleionea sediminis TaxID=2569479 RepID=UPI0011872859|nr:hypothetical protein [Pleionea sediminis]